MTESPVCLASLFGLFDNGIHRLNMTREYELEKIKEWSTINQNNRTFVAPIDNAYLMDYDPVGNALYVAECALPVRPVIMSCPKTRGIFRVSLNGGTAAAAKKEVRRFDATTNRQLG